MQNIIGYCRVSTDGQTLDDQIAALKAAGATRMFSEKQSGARTDRPQLRKAIAALGTGDTLIVTPARPAGSLDPRLAQCPARRWRVWRGVQVAGRHLGRYHDAAWSAHGDGVGRSCRVRAQLDQGPH